MSPSEIKTFEDLWKKLTEMFYAIVNFIKKALGVNIDVGATETANIENINPIY